MTEAPRRATFREVFGIAEFRALWFAELLSIFGDQMARVALSVLVFQETKSATLTGLTYALTYAPSLLGGIFLTGLADRFPRREVMVGVDLARAALIALVAVPAMPLWLVCVLVASVSMLNPVFKASQLATLPDMLEGDRYIAGMAIRNMTVQSAQLAGFLGGGALLLQVEPHIALAIDAVTFIASAALLRTGVHSRPAAMSKKERQPFFNSLGQGGKLIFADPGLRVLLIFTWIPGLLPVYEGIAAPYAELFGGGSLAISFLLASDPLGSVLGAFIYTRWVSPAVRPRLPGVLSLAATLPLLVCYFQPGLVVSVVLFIVSGGLGTVALMQATASLSLAVPDARRAQAMGLSNTGLTTIMGISPLIGGLMTEGLGAQHTVAVFGTAGLLLAVPLAIAWHRNIVKSPDRWIPSNTTPTNQG
jgi:MFS family permease